MTPGRDERHVGNHHCFQGLTDETIWPRGVANCLNPVVSRLEFRGTLIAR